MRGSRSSMAPTLLDTHYVCALAFRLCYVAQPPKRTTMEPSLSADAYTRRSPIAHRTRKLRQRANISTASRRRGIRAPRASNRTDPATDGCYVSTDISFEYTRVLNIWLKGFDAPYLRFVHSRPRFRRENLPPVMRAK